MIGRGFCVIRFMRLLCGGVYYSFYVGLVNLYACRERMENDRFHRHADQIYRVTLKSKYDQNWSSYTSAPTAPYAAKEFPGIEEYVRVADWLFDVKKATDKEYLRNKNCLQVDKQFFDLFSFPLVSAM